MVLQSFQSMPRACCPCKRVTPQLQHCGQDQALGVRQDCLPCHLPSCCGAAARAASPRLACVSLGVRREVGVGAACVGMLQAAAQSASTSSQHSSTLPCQSLLSWAICPGWGLVVLLSWQGRTLPPALPSLRSSMELLLQFSLSCGCLLKGQRVVCGMCLTVPASVLQVLAPSSCIQSMRGSVAFPWTPMTSQMLSCLCRGPLWRWGSTSMQVTQELGTGQQGWRDWGGGAQGRPPPDPPLAVLCPRTSPLGSSG